MLKTPFHEEIYKNIYFMKIIQIFHLKREFIKTSKHRNLKSFKRLSKFKCNFARAAE